MRTTDDAPQHVCAGLDGRKALLVQVKRLGDTPDARHVLCEREDFIGGWYGADRYMSVRTDHGDGSNDVLVYLPTVYHDLRAHEGPQMAWSTSAAMPYSLTQTLQKLINLSGDTFKALYYNNSVTPVNTATTAATSEVNGSGSAFQTANEQTTSGTYTQGTGMAINTPAITQNYNSQGNNTVSFTATSITSATSFTSLASGLYGMVVADTTVPGSGVSYIISYHYFGGQQLVTAGTFAVTINANGFVTYTC
jgi:hypothetical protein